MVWTFESEWCKFHPICTNVMMLMQTDVAMTCIQSIEIFYFGPGIVTDLSKHRDILFWAGHCHWFIRWNDIAIFLVCFSVIIFDLTLRVLTNNIDLSFESRCHSMLCQVSVSVANLQTGYLTKGSSLRSWGLNVNLAYCALIIIKEIRWVNCIHGLCL